MKTETIEKTVTVLETKDFIDFLEDNHMMDKFREACLAAKDPMKRVRDIDTPGLASRPDFIRNYIREIKRTSIVGTTDWFRGLISGGFYWAKVPFEIMLDSDSWVSLHDKWEKFCRDSGAEDFEI